MKLINLLRFVAFAGALVDGSWADEAANVSPSEPSGTTSGAPSEPSGTSTGAPSKPSGTSTGAPSKPSGTTHEATAPTVGPLSTTIGPDPELEGFSDHYGPAGNKSKNCREYFLAKNPTFFYPRPFSFIVYGPYFMNIKYLEIHPGNDSKYGRVKLNLGGVGHHYALVGYQTSKRWHGYTFTINICF